MKTKLFGPWTPLMQQFIKDVAKEASVAEVEAWMDKDGYKEFQLGQMNYHEANKSKYFTETDQYPPQVKIELAYQQLVAGFDRMYNSLVLYSCGLLKENALNIYHDFKKEALGEKFLPYIATRAVITAQVVKMNDPDKLKALDFVIQSYEFLEEASRAAVESMKSYRPAVLPSVKRDEGSCTLFKAEVEKVANESQLRGNIENKF